MTDSDVAPEEAVPSPVYSCLLGTTSETQSTTPSPTFK